MEYGANGSGLSGSFYRTGLHREVAETGSSGMEQQEDWSFDVRI